MSPKQRTTIRYQDEERARRQRNEAETSNATFPAEYSADDIMPTSSSRFEDESEVWQRWVDSTHLMMWRHKRFFVSLEESAGVSTNILKQIMSCPFLPSTFRLQRRSNARLKWRSDSLLQ